jgi:hypothetical protein
MSDSIQNKIELLAAYRKRLHLLELRAGREGYTTDPAVLNEIDEIKPIIAKLEAEIAAHRSASGQKVGREGYTTDPAVLNEIDEIQPIITKLEAEIAAHRSATVQEFEAPSKDQSVAHTNGQVILRFVDVTLLAYVTYQGSKRTDRDTIAFVENWADLLDNLRFCKKVHDAFQTFDTAFKRFLRDCGDSSNIKKIQEGWQSNHVSSRNVIDLRLDFHDLQQHTVPVPSSNKIPHSIRFQTKKVTDLYPRLLGELNQFMATYELQEEVILKQFSLNRYVQLNTTLKGLSESILNSADTMLVQLVHILLYNYDVAMSGNS